MSGLKKVGDYSFHEDVWELILIKVVIIIIKLTNIIDITSITLLRCSTVKGSWLPQTAVLGTRNAWLGCPDSNGICDLCTCPSTN